MKLNVDGALFGEERGGGIGSVLPDSQGEILMACVDYFVGITDVITIEAMAMVKALEATMEAGFQWG